MNKHLPFLLGLILGPIGVLVSWLCLGRESFLPSVKGVGVLCCIVCVLMFGKSDGTREEEHPIVHVVDENKPEHCEAENGLAEPQVDSVDEVTNEEERQTGKTDQKENVNLDPAEQETQEKLSRVVNIICQYQSRNGRLPESLDDLDSENVANSRIPHRDAWGRRFFYGTAGGNFAVVSSGGDKTFDTDDDVVLIWRPEAPTPTPEP